MAAVDARANPPASPAAPGTPIRVHHGVAPRARDRRLGSHRRSRGGEDIHLALPGKFILILV